MEARTTRLRRLPVGGTNFPPGRDLNQQEREWLEAGFQVPLDDVRIHIDESAGLLALNLDASAVSIGQHIFFAPGLFDTSTLKGRALLAHETAHVVQQRRDGRVSSKEAVEDEALAAGVAVASGAKFQTSQIASGGVLRQELDEDERRRAIRNVTNYDFEEADVIIGGSKARPISSLVDTMGGTGNVGLGGEGGPSSLPTSVGLSEGSSGSGLPTSQPSKDAKTMASSQASAGSTSHPTVGGSKSSTQGGSGEGGRSSPSVGEFLVTLGQVVGLDPSLLDDPVDGVEGGIPGGTGPKENASSAAQALYAAIQVAMSPLDELSDLAKSGIESLFAKYGSLWEKTVAVGLEDVLEGTGRRVLTGSSVDTPVVEVARGVFAKRVANGYAIETPFGRRVLDGLVIDAGGRLIGGYEAKAGTSAYKLLQRVKDAYIINRYGFPIFETRFPFARTMFDALGKLR